MSKEKEEKSVVEPSILIKQGYGKVKMIATIGKSVNKGTEYQFTLATCSNFIQDELAVPALGFEKVFRDATEFVENKAEALLALKPKKK